eukprot:gene23141-24504_t
MNASLDSGGSGNGSLVVKEEVARAGGVDMLLAAVRLSPEQRAKVASAGGGSLLSRKAGLLSRLSSLTSVQELLLDATAYRSICRRLAPSNDNLTSMEPEDKWVIDEKSHYVRILASLGATAINAVANKKNGKGNVQTSVVSLTDVEKIALEESLVASLLALFPRPREDCGVITPQTVTLMPLVTGEPLLIGNAARCLMTLADLPSCAEQLYGTNKRYQSLIGVEKLICAMATCVDMRVRKNIAILLAKGCKIPQVREKITTFRGMQMMVELQDKL